MIGIEKTNVTGVETAVRGMRNPLNSWRKSDSYFDGEYCKKCSHRDANCDPEKPCFKNGVLGENDLALMEKLVKAGTDHRKFMRFITVTCDITAPLYWWKEFDTYKVGTVANSCSTMHTICNKEFSVDDFSNEHLSHSADGGAHCKLERVGEWETELYPIALLRLIVVLLNSNRNMYLQTKDKKYWWQIIQLLPSSYNQRRTVLLNYEVLLNMYHARKNHKLDEWRDFCEWIESLPYMGVFLNA